MRCPEVSKGLVRVLAHAGIYIGLLSAASHVGLFSDVVTCQSAPCPFVPLLTASGGWNKRTVRYRVDGLSSHAVAEAAARAAFAEWTAFNQSNNSQIEFVEAASNQTADLTVRVATAPLVMTTTINGVTTSDHVAAWAEGFTPVSATDILRHTFCSHLAMRGAPTRAIQEVAGHQDIGTTQRYMHLSPAAIRSAIDLLEQPAPTSARGDIVETEMAESVK